MAKRYSNFKKTIPETEKKIKTQSKGYLIIILILFLFFLVKGHLESSSPKSEEPGFGRVSPVETIQPEPSTAAPSSSSTLDLADIPPYEGHPAYAINNNKPFFTDEDYEKAQSYYLSLSELDSLGRCGVCEGSLGEDTLAGERDFDLSHVKPSGWKQARYEDLVDNGGWLYNRCHLIMYAVSGLTDDPRNIITGTRYMNNDGMLAYSEKAVQNWIIRKANGGRVLYRAEPIFAGNELVCRGVHLQAGDVESKGQNFHINVYCYNVQPGVKIDYATGYSMRSGV